MAEPANQGLQGSMPGGSVAIGKVKVIGAAGASVGATVGSAVGSGAVVLVGAALGSGGGVSVDLASTGCSAGASVGGSVVAVLQAANTDALPKRAAVFRKSLRLMGFLYIVSPFL